LKDASLIAALTLINDYAAPIREAAGSCARKIARIVARQEDASLLHALVKGFDGAGTVGEATPSARIRLLSVGLVAFIGEGWN
jgi:hypothetical protein